jgi:mono/diheme cytochrome c family protein
VHNVHPPSLVREDWPFESVPAVRRQIFIGHPAGMPTWGVAGITPREIDAIAYYILEVLRPEVLGR